MTLACPAPPLAVPERSVGPTLDDLIVGTWGLLATARAAPCPLCGGDMAPSPGAGHHAAGGRCVDCGARLS